MKLQHIKFFYKAIRLFHVKNFKMTQHCTHSQISILLVVRFFQNISRDINIIGIYNIHFYSEMKIAKYFLFNGKN